MDIESLGGAAFPQSSNHYGGLTMFDYFAACAMQGLCAADKHNAVTDSDALAEISYSIAVKMLNARNKAIKELF